MVDELLRHLRPRHVQTGPRPGSPPRSKRRLGAAVAASLAVHGAALLALLSAASSRLPPPRAQAAPVGVSLAPTPSAPPEPRAPARAATPSARSVGRTSAPHRPVARAPAPSLPLPAGEGRAEGAAQGDDEAIGEAELAGAAVAGGGGSGGCDLATRLQAALRGDRQVRAELAAVAPGARALRLWNGDWIAHAGQEGRGLAAIREVILWEVGFSPPPCKREQMHGLVLLVVPAATGGDVRLALGAPAWRWSDLLGLGAARSVGAGGDPP